MRAGMMMIGERGRAMETFAENEAGLNVMARLIPPWQGATLCRSIRAAGRRKRLDGSRYPGISVA
jgi:hypothetical protein